MNDAMIQKECQNELAYKNYYYQKTGIQNEYDFIRTLNKKKYKELNILFQMFLTDLYERKIDDDAIIYAWKNMKPQKTDFYIRLQSEQDIKRISLKKGIKNSVHVERISEFIHFLIENKVPKEIIQKYLEYHYADGTRNGTGIVRQSVAEYKKQHQEEIDQINQAINNPDLIKKAIDRFVIQGKNDSHKIDMIVYGFIHDFVWLKKEDIYKVILSKINDYSTSVHFGSLTCQSLDRCLNKNPTQEKRRYCVQLKWYNIYDEIIEHLNNEALKRYHHYE